MSSVGSVSFCVPNSCASSKHSMAKQVESRTSIGLAFDELETVDLPFSLALTPLMSESRLDGVLVALDACGKRPQFWNLAFKSHFQPGFQGRCMTLSDHLHEGLRQFTGRPHLRMGLLQEEKQLLI